MSDGPYSYQPLLPSYRLLQDLARLCTFRPSSRSINITRSLTTPSGNLIGCSSPTQIQSSPTIKKATVLGALTWRHYAATDSGTGADTSASPDSANDSRRRRRPRNGAEAATAAARPLQAQPLAVLHLEQDAAGGLKALTVDVGGRECAWEGLREGLLVGVLGPEAHGGNGSNAEGSSDDETAVEGRDHSGGDGNGAEDGARDKARRWRSTYGTSGRTSRCPRICADPRRVSALTVLRASSKSSSKASSQLSYSNYV